MKKFLALAACIATASLYAVDFPAASTDVLTRKKPAGATQYDLLNGTFNIASGDVVTFKSGSILTLSGSFGGTPTGGTLDLSNITLTLPAATIGLFQPIDTDLTAIAALSTTATGRALLTYSAASGDMVYYNGTAWTQIASTVNGRSLLSISSLTAAGLGLTNGAAIDALGAVASNGLLARTASNTYAARTLTGTSNEITVTNGDGVSGAPSFSLPSALTFTGKTVTGGTFNSGAFNGTLGATTPSTISATTITASGQITSTVSTGTAPFVVASTTAVSNLNASLLLGSTWASPAAIGTGTPAAGTFTTLTGTSVVLNGTAGAGYAEFANQASAPSTPTSAGRLFWDSSNRLSWIGTNGFTRTFDGTANTANRTYTLPDVSSTFVMLANPSAGVAVTNVNSITAASATALDIAGGATSGNVTIHTNATTLAATFSGANTTLAGTLVVKDGSVSANRVAGFGWTQDAGSGVDIKNTSTGTGSYTFYSLSNNGGTTGFLYTFSPTYTTSGRYAQDSLVLESTGAGGMNFSSSTASPVFRWYGNGNTVEMTLTGSALSGLSSINGGAGTFTTLSASSTFTATGSSNSIFSNSGTITTVTLGLGAAGENSRLVMRANATQTAWRMASSETIGSALEFAASTAGGGTTFSSPSFTLTTTSATFTAATASTNSSTGAVIVSAGGLGVSGAINAGGAIVANATGSSFSGTASIGTTLNIAGTVSYNTGRLNVGSLANVYAASFENGASAGSSFGLKVAAGGNSSDVAMQISDRANSSLLKIAGDGTMTLNAYGSGGGAVSVGAADSGGSGFKVLRVPN